MDALVTNNLKSEEPDDDVMVGDNAMSVKRGASFLMGYDPYEDTAKPMPKSSIGDAPMGAKPTENPLDGDGLKIKSSGDSSYGGDTTIAAASNLGPNPLGPNPFGLDFDEFNTKDKPAAAPASASTPVSAPAPVPIPGRVSMSTPASAPAPASVSTPVSTPAPAKASAPVSTPVPASVKESKPETVKVMEPKENPLSKFISVGERSMIIFGSDFFGIDVAVNDFAEEEEDKPVQASSDEEVKETALESSEESVNATSLPDKKELKTLEEDKIDDVLGREEKKLEPADDDSMGLTFGVTVSEDDEKDLPLGTPDNDDDLKSLMSDVSADDNPIEQKSKDDAPKGVDPLMALLMAGGNPFGDNAKASAPDLSFGKEALKPKHFEPMKASGPRVTAENVQANKPLGDNPFGVEVVPDFSMGKEALKPKKYVPKKSYEATGALSDDQGEEPKSDTSGNDDV